MKYLQDYMTAKQDKVFKEHQAFFAFSDKQVGEGMKEHGLTSRERLCNMGSGMVCPKENADNLLKDLTKIYQDSIKQDIKENGINKIVRRELSNHECYYTGDCGACVEKLADYPINPDDIVKIFRNKNHLSITPATA